MRGRVQTLVLPHFQGFQEWNLLVCTSVMENVQVNSQISKNCTLGIRAKKKCQRYVVRRTEEQVNSSKNLGTCLSERGLIQQ